MPSVSVIVPVYNTAKYLERCLNSLLEQSLRDIEIIVINDGSVDNSDEILKEYAQKHEVIRYYSQANQGISKTRNYGISIAKAPYIVFIDSDDYVDCEMLMTMLQAMQKQDLDIVVCDFYECNIDTKEEKHIELANFSPCVIEENPSLLFSINSSPWNKMFKTSFLIEKHLQFPEALKYEDAQFLLCALAQASQIGKVAKPFVYYQVHVNSETTSMDKRVFDIFKILNNIEAYLKEINKWDALYMYWEYFVINRITVYNLQQVYQKNTQLAISFINHSFTYLEQKYPNWRDNKAYIESNSKGKRFIKSSLKMTKFYMRLARLRGRI